MSARIKRLYGLPIIMLLTLLGVTGCGTESVIEDIVVYTALEDDQIPRYLESFEEAHPNINVSIVRESTGAITERLLAEKDNPRADVVWGLAATSLLVADSQGQLEPYTPDGLDRVQSRFRDAADPPHWVGIDAWMTAFCVNTDEVARLGLPTPSSWAELVDPVYKDQIVMPNPNSSGTGFLSVSAILQLMGEAEGWDYMDALHENIALYTHSGSQPCRMAGAGDYPIGISFGYRASIQIDEGLPMVAVFPQEGSGWDLEANALIKKENIKEAARIFLDWAISDEAMEEYAQSFPLTAVKLDVSVPTGFPDDASQQLIDNDFVWAAANRQTILDEWLKRYDSKSAPRE